MALKIKGSNPFTHPMQTSYFAVAKSEVFVYDLGGNPDGFPLRPLSFRNLKQVKNLFGNDITSYCNQKDIMPTNGVTKPFVGINLAENRIALP